MACTRLSPDRARQILLRHVQASADSRQPSTGRGSWRVRVRSYAPGDVVLQADAQASRLSLIVQGQLAVYTGQRREDRPLVVLTPGRTFGRATPALCPAGAILSALTRCEIWFLEPAPAQAKADLGRPRAETARRDTAWARLGWAVVIVLAAALLLALPAPRGTLAVIPLGLGDWFHQQGSDWCAGGAWKVARLMAPHDAAPALALGALSFRQGNLAGAEQTFEQARAADPNCPEAYNNLGVVYYLRGEYQRAATAFEQALILEPGSAPAEQNLGDSLLALQAYDEAIVHYRAALGLGEPKAQTLANMAVALYQSGEPAEATQKLEQALAQAGDDGLRDQIGRTLAALQAASGRGDSP